MNPGNYYLSLAVKDIQKSFEFYHRLGFEPMEDMGSLEDKWVVMSCGEAKIGLYEGTLQKNTITFLSENARNIHEEISDYVQVVASSGIDADAGPCYFMVRDPDGNPVMFDQQND